MRTEIITKLAELDVKHFLSGDDHQTLLDRALKLCRDKPDYEISFLKLAVAGEPMLERPKEYWHEDRFNALKEWADLFFQEAEQIGLRKVWQHQKDYASAYNQLRREMIFTIAAEKKKNPAAAALGSVTSEAKAKAVRENGKKGGRPRKKPEQK